MACYSRTGFLSNAVLKYLVEIQWLGMLFIRSKFMISATAG